MTDNLENLATLLLLFLVVPLMILSVYARFAARRARATQARELAEFRQRLRQPQIAELEQHFGRVLPESFRRLHEDAQRVSRTDFSVSPPDAGTEARSWQVAGFLPADSKTLAEGWSELGKNNLPFACDEAGDPYYIPLDQATNLDGPVWQFHHEDGAHERVAASLEEFLSWLERSEPAAGK